MYKSLLPPSLINVGDLHRGDCDGLAVNGCETDLLSDTANCGNCSFNCNSQGYLQVSSTYCLNGFCQIVGCNPGYYNCDGQTSTGCETVLPCCSLPADCAANQ